MDLSILKQYVTEYIFLCSFVTFLIKRLNMRMAMHASKTFFAHVLKYYKHPVE